MGKAKELFAKLKNVKHIQLIAGAAVIVVVLVVYFSFASCSSPRSTNASASVNTDSLDYCTAMRVRLEKIVSQIEGVGDASVIINWDKSASVSTVGSAENPQATGAVIVCKGGNSTKVKLDVMYAVSTLLNLSIEKIMVYPKS